MAIRIFWLILFGGLIPHLFAQEESPQPTPITLLDTAFLMPPLSNKVFSYYFYDEGEVLFTLEAKDKPLLYVEVEEVPGIYRFSQFKTEGFEETIANEEHSLYRFKFKNTSSIRPRYIKLKIQHTPAPFVAPVVARDTIWDTIYAETIRQKVYVDKIKYVTVTDSIATAAYSLMNGGGGGADGESETIPLAPFLAFPDSGMKLKEITLPTDRRILRWAYWIGVGAGAAQNYANLQDQLPESWAEEGIATPLHAYAVGRLKKLPKPSVGEQVTYAFLNPAQATRFFNKVPLDSILDRSPAKAIVAYGIVPIEEGAQSVIRLALENTNRVTAITVHVKIIAIVEDNLIQELIPGEK